ncbi:MAG: hypothetical protein MK135_12170, partial [Polyangiaceae bacterium]|nr:hypothetical protein [Polyangiaceae bacterium]
AFLVAVAGCVRDLLAPRVLVVGLATAVARFLVVFLAAILHRLFRCYSSSAELPKRAICASATGGRF